MARDREQDDAIVATGWKFPNWELKDGRNHACHRAVEAPVAAACVVEKLKAAVARCPRHRTPAALFGEYPQSEDRLQLNDNVVRS